MPRKLLVGAIAVGIASAALYQLGVPLRASHGARVTGDEPFYLLTAVSLLADRDLDLVNDYALGRYRAFYDHSEELWHQSVPTPDARVLSPHNLGLSALILPAYALAGVDGAKAFLGLLGGLTIVFTALLAFRATGYVWPSLGAAAMLAASAPLFVYSTQVYPEVPAALTATAGLWLLLGPRVGRGTAVGLAIVVLAILWLGAKYAPVALLLALAGIWRADSRSRVLLSALVATGLAGYVWFHLTMYGGFTPYGMNSVFAGSNDLELVGLHFELWNRLYRLGGLWIDREFGLLRWVPALALALPGVAILVIRRRPHLPWVVAVFVAQFLVAVFFSVTMRGWWFPGRMLIVVLPLLAVPLAEALEGARNRPWLGISAAILAAYSGALTIALWSETSAEAVVLAVDPFRLQWAPFQAVAGLFPVYTDYGPLTWLLTAAWLLTGWALIRLGVHLTLPFGRPGPVPAGSRESA